MNALKSVARTQRVNCVVIVYAHVLNIFLTDIFKDFDPSQHESRINAAGMPGQHYTHSSWGVTATAHDRSCMYFDSVYMGAAQREVK